MAAFDASQILLLWIHRDGEILFVNEALARELRSRAELLERRRADALGSRFARDFAAAVEGLPRGGKVRYETEAVRSDGTPVPLGVSASSFELEEGNGTTYLIVAADLSSQIETRERLRETQEMLFQAQKMEAIGRLAGGVAHDFNNLLAVVVGSVELMESGTLSEGETAAIRKDIRDAADRGARLTRQLLAFSRQQVVNPALHRPSHLVTELAKLLRRMLGAGVELVVEAGELSSLIRIDPTQLEQVLINLAVNARDAMADGGRLTVRVREREVRFPFPSARDLVPAGNYVQIDVEDTGTGMKPETVARVFEPFFTTKDRGRGTGLGLAAVYGIVRQVGGYVVLDTEPGRGTRFELLFPVVAAEPGEGSALPAPNARPGSGERLLYVEDDHDLRRLTSRTLQSLGFDVRVARDAQEALAAAASEPFALLVSDVVLPGMNGLELAKRLAAERPELRVLFVSGYAEDADVLHEIVSGNRPLLSKPFHRAALAEAISEALAGAPFGGVK